MVANAAAAIPLMKALERNGYRSRVAPDPYAAALEVVRRPLVFRAVVLSVAALYPEEFRLIDLLKARFAHIDVIVADAAGRPGAIEEATRRGADALLKEDRFQRLGPPGGLLSTPTQAQAAEPSKTEAVLSAEEIRALLG